jgi:hypothetical protein
MNEMDEKSLFFVIDQKRDVHIGGGNGNLDFNNLSILLGVSQIRVCRVISLGSPTIIT